MFFISAISRKYRNPIYEKSQHNRRVYIDIYTLVPSKFFRRGAGLTEFIMADESEKYRNYSASEWKKRLSRRQYHVLREKATEAPYIGKYNKHTKPGVYSCAGCQTPLYTSKHKFDSGSGWPAFFDSIPGAVASRRDGYRTELLCNICNGHLGHIFLDEGFDNPTNARHCVNSVALSFKKDTTLENPGNKKSSCKKFFKQLFNKNE